MEMEMCEVQADDGRKCARVAHPADPDWHDFTRQARAESTSARPVAHWIDMVYAVRKELMNFPVHAGAVETMERFHKIALAVGFEIIEIDGVKVYGGEFK